MERWNNKVAVVTGASAGIGLEITKTLLRHGLNVVGLARRKEKMEKELNNFNDAKGKFYAHQCDVANENDVKSAFEWIKKNVGTIQVLVNNAGLGFPGSIADITNETVKTIVGVNLLGVIWCTKEALKIMKGESQLESIIININSIEGHRVYKFLDLDVNVYPATKHGVTGFSESLRSELMGQKIRVTNLCPGLVKTDIAGANGIDQGIWSEPHIQSKDIADAVTYVIGAPSNVQITELIIRPLGERAVAY
ncbi:hypothetical protein HCN44_008225 [Aphidius gifuensis]|uniref:Farnesol dehydrogenase-like n=1 Tax=Aphidius gifuensis TaxID=684658 RepID=A0A834XRL6_APHGI|nr:farnesol dehydrogenase-like [Aphidius gifuensis]KAF7989551.1 hypothetical protein HCN44_008225 [Aphidius gifuensis]